MYLLYCSHKSIESILNTCCTYGCSYTITPSRTDMHGPRTDVHGHWPVRATDSTDISLCVPRTHGRATDMPRTFPVAPDLHRRTACTTRTAEERRWSASVWCRASERIVGWVTTNPVVYSRGQLREIEGRSREDIRSSCAYPGAEIAGSAGRSQIAALARG